MSDILTSGNEQQADMKEVYYSGTDTLKEGYALCYNYDSVTDYQQFTSTQQNFTRAAVALAEGSQDFNARYMEVEKPSASNLHCFAGFVDAESAGKTGPCMIKINLAVNGVVPVFTDLSVTNGQTLLAVKSGSYYATTPIYTSSAASFMVVGVAAETVNRSSTNGLTWARVGPQYGLEFAGNGATAGNLIVGAGTTTGEVIGKFISMESAQTGGSFSALRLRGEIAGAAGGGELGAGARIEGVVNSTSVGNTCAASTHLIFKTGATVAGTLYEGLYCKAENQDTTPAALSGCIVSAARFVTQLNEDPGTHCMMRFETEGSDKPDYWFTAKDANAVAAQTADTTFTPNYGGTIKIEIAGTAYYIPFLSDLA